MIKGVRVNNDFSAKILVIEDDNELRTTLVTRLKKIFLKYGMLLMGLLV